MKLIKMKKFILCFLVLALGLVAFVEAAQALRITLKRVVFEGSKRAEVITIINSTDKPETYRLGWRHYRMTANTSLEALPEGAPLPADIRPSANMVRFAPRRFTIPPKSSQQVRMMLRMPKDLPDGEYRSHFWVRPEINPDDVELEVTEDQKKAGAKGGVTLKMLAGVTMPVIVRKGALEATASFANVTASESTGFVAINFSILRQGTRSIYGDIDYICNAGSGNEFKLRTSKGIAVYTELGQRNFKVRIPKKQGQSGCGSLSLVFTEIVGFGGEKGKVLAETTIPVNQ